MAAMTNADRAERAASAVKAAYNDVVQAEDLLTAAQDMVCDALHLAIREGVAVENLAHWLKNRLATNAAERAEEAQLPE